MTRLNFLFTTWEGGGNVPPALEVARKLVQEGHRVRVMSEECNRVESEATGASFTAWTRALSRSDKFRSSQIANDWAASSPQVGLMNIVRDIWCKPALDYARDVLDELKREQANLIVTCEALFGVMAACESIKQPFVLLCPNISLAGLPGVPPLGPGLMPARNDEEREMHAQIATAMRDLLDGGLPYLNEARAALGLPPVTHLIDQFNSAEAELLATSPAFDFPADSLPDRVRYVGPQVADPHWTQPWVSPWPTSDTRPLVTVGFSTTFQNHVAVVQNVIDALASLPVRVLVTRGSSIERRDLEPAANSVIVDSAPHAAVMRESAFAVTHGGHGTVIRGLYSRIPLLVIPHGRDQNDNAVRVTARGAGLSLTPDASVDEIRAACQRLLNEPEFKDCAKRLGDAVAYDADNSTVVQTLESFAKNEQLAPT
ncbi:MAG TPA: nucleotide disphospho-sugar-binding domain-containing protein [Planktothrix sp.]